MKSCSTLALLFALVLVVGCRQQKAIHHDYVTDLDFTTTTYFDVASFDGKQSLREFGTNNCVGFSDYYIFGEYRNPMDITGGHNFHVFPDGCFVIEEFYDIGEPVTVASGRWKLDGNVLLVFDLVERKDASVVFGMKWVKEHFGTVGRLRLFVTGHGESIGDTILVAEDTVKKDTHIEWKYVRRIEYYRDWPKEQQRLLTK